MLLTNCKTPIAIVLFGAKDTANLYRFPVEAPETPGLMFMPTPLLPINEQILDKISTVFSKIQPRHINVWQQFSCEIELSDHRKATLYLASSDQISDFDLCNWQTLPEILRSMPKTRNRLPYLKALQVLSGALAENVKVFEGEEAAKLLN